MTPIEFPEHNVVFAKDQPEYLPLPAHKSNGVTGGSDILCHVTEMSWLN